MKNNYTVKIARANNKTLASLKQYSVWDEIFAVVEEKYSYLVKDYNGGKYDKRRDSRKTTSN